jgi:arylformamidase
MDALFRGMDQPALDAAYNNTAAVADVADLVTDFVQRSNAVYLNRTCQRNLAYGPGPAQRFDWFPAANPTAPLIVYIHGGYWQSRSKEDFAFVGEGALQRGYHVIHVEYTLAPTASLSEIVAEVGALLDHLHESLPGLGVRPQHVCVAGHSAGAQLAVMHRAHPLIDSIAAISGLYELEPISLCYVNDKLRLSAEEIVTCSPQRHIGKGVPMLVIVGAAELPELVRHSAEYAQACKDAGESVEYLAVPGRNHFTILNDMAAIDGPVLKGIERLMKPSAATS